MNFNGNEEDEDDEEELDDVVLFKPAFHDVKQEAGMPMPDQHLATWDGHASSNNNGWYIFIK